MKNYWVVSLVIVAAVAALLLVSNNVSINVTKRDGVAATPSPAAIQSRQSPLTKESAEGPVTVTVTPKNLEEGTVSWDFDIALNTHTVEISQDLVTVSKLVDERGREYRPTSWVGDPPGGHHRQGVLKFEPVSPRPKWIELKIKDIGGIPERSFRWEL